MKGKVKEFDFDNSVLLLNDSALLNHSSESVIQLAICKYSHSLHLLNESAV